MTHPVPFGEMSREEQIKLVVAHFVDGKAAEVWYESLFANQRYSGWFLKDRERVFSPILAYRIKPEEE